MNYEIGARIRKYRELKKISQKELAAEIGVSSSRVSNWEQGINRPDVDFLASICQALDVSPSELLDIRLSTDELTTEERQIILAYRRHTDMQHSVNVLLGIDVVN